MDSQMKKYLWFFFKIPSCRKSFHSLQLIFFSHLSYFLMFVDYVQEFWSVIFTNGLAVKKIFFEFFNFPSNLQFWPIQTRRFINHIIDPNKKTKQFHLLLSSDNFKYKYWLSRMDSEKKNIILWVSSVFHPAGRAVCFFHFFFS